MSEDNVLERGTEKKKNAKIWGYIGAAVFSATVLAVVFLAPGNQNGNTADIKAPASLQSPAVSKAPAVSETPGPADKADDTPVAAPLIYENGADIFMASGENRIKLGTRQSLYGCYKEMNCVLSQNNRYLYYIENTDIHTGMGTLKKISTDAESVPVTVAEGVCAAQASPDGALMYIKNVSGMEGELYLYKDGKSSLADKNVLPVYFKFSEGGNCISYIVRESAGAFALYVKKEDEEPRMVTPFTAEASIDGGVNLSRISGTVPFDSGQILYSIEENYNMPLYFYDPGNKTERVCNDGYIVKTYIDGSFLYADIAKNNLWYKSPGTAAVNITSNYSYTRFPEGTNSFLLMEHLGDSFENSRFAMYEVGENGGKTLISVGDSRVIEINCRFDCVAFESEGKLYASRKTDNRWVETVLLKKNENKAGAGSKSDIVARFDCKGENLYYFDAYECGPLSVYSLKENKTAELLGSADCLYVTERAVYAHTAGDRLYSIEGGTVKMVSEGVRDVRETRGGAFFIVGGAFKYIPEGSEEAMPPQSFTREAETTGLVSFRPPLEEDLITALEVLSDEAYYCLYQLRVYRTATEELIDIDDALAITQKLAERQDISETERNILKYMAEGFKAYKENNRKTAKASLQKALDAYAGYMNSARGAEEK